MGLLARHAADYLTRMQAEQALRRSETRYRTLFDSIDEGYCIVRVLFDDNGQACDYRFEEVNQSFARQTGFHNVVGRSMREIMPDHEAHWFETYGRIVTTGRAERFIHSTGAPQRWFNVYAFRMGNPAERQVAVLLDDISERKAAEEALRLSEKRLRAIIEQLPAAVNVTDRTGSRTLSNSVMERYLSRTNPLQAASMKQWEAWDEHGVPVPLRNLPDQRALRGETVMPGLEMRHTDADGSESWVRMSAAPLRDDDGDVVGACSVIQDVTLVKQAAQALHEADRRKDEFLATLAHELRNPLAPIRNGLYILRSAAEAGDDAKGTAAVCAMLERQVEHLVRLVDDLLEVSRITGGKIELRREMVDLRNVIRNAIDTSRPLIDAAHHHLTVRMPAYPVMLDADPVRLTQVVANLLNNAARYTSDGGRICVTVGGEQGHAVLSVRDNGNGIPEPMLPRVFDIFTQVEHTPQGGLGIGLTLVRSLVAMHGGIVEARSAGVGKGSEFVVRLPLVSVPDDRAEPAARQGIPPPGLVPHRILVVDDNEDAADSLGIILRGLGNEVRIAHDGETGLAAIEAERPDVVLLDLGMPGMDGYELARQVRTTLGDDDVTLIALTGWGQEEDRRRSKEAGIDHHLVKPVDFAALWELLSTADKHPPPHCPTCPARRFRAKGTGAEAPLDISATLALPGSASAGSTRQAVAAGGRQVQITASEQTPSTTNRPWFRPAAGTRACSQFRPTRPDDVPI
ncbi:PAS domain-containing hybrid sensor histidine kinase/response regulator [Tahibacter amnicola]|uniref:histidine kinase n=1 Tax=Tahibacter amnicola TaxID=2976241 RepID=A0ABY6B8L5_9GAMM|nr:ATP-binding protein [Tahibacter amnicola]UXI65851.1 PAS domain S-box protein [Tahibacter amnicola]